MRPHGSLWKRCFEQSAELVVTDYIVTEAVNLANARSGTRVAMRVLDLIEQSAGIRVESFLSKAR